VYKRLRISDLIKHKGGASKVARLCGVSHPAVSRWSTLGSIPVKQALLLEQLWGIDCDLLHNPWGRRCMLASTFEQAAVIGGDYHMDWRAPAGVIAPGAADEVLLYDPDEPIEFEPFAEGEGWDDDD